MEIVDKGSKPKGFVCASATTDNVKTKANTTLSPSTGIMSYFKRSVVPETIEHIPNQQGSLTIAAPVSHIKKSPGGQNMERKLQLDCCRESVIGVEEHNACKDGGNCNSTSSGHSRYCEIVFAESKIDFCAGGDQIPQHNELEESKTKCNDNPDDCQVHRHNKSIDLQDSFSHQSDSSCMQDGGTGTCSLKHRGDVTTEDNHGVDSMVIDNGNCANSLKLPQPNRSKWNFTWKATKRSLKTTKEDSGEEDFDIVECVDMAGIDIKQGSPFSKANRKKRKRTGSEKMAHEDQAVILLDILEIPKSSMNSVKEPFIKTVDTNTSTEIINGSFVVRHGDNSTEPKQNHSNNDINDGGSGPKDCANVIKDCEAISNLLVLPLTPKVGLDSCDIEQEKSKKSFFDVLMQRSKDRTSAIQISPEAICDTDILEGKVVGVGGKDCEKSSIRDVSENGRNNLRESKTSRNKPHAKGKSFHEQNLLGETITKESDGCGIPAEHVSRRSSRRLATISRSGDIIDSNSGKLEETSQWNNIRKSTRKSFLEADTIEMVIDVDGAKKQNKRKSRHPNKDKSNLLTPREIEGIEMDLNCEPSVSKKEEKLSNTDKSKCDDVREEHFTKKGTGSIAPIFLPGAWRRGKQKVEQEQLQESLVEVDGKDPDLNSISQDAITVYDEKTNSLKGESNHGYSSGKDASQRLQEFLGMFKTAPVMSNVEVVQLIAAPFPVVSHVLQIDDELQEKWNLPAVNNRFVKEEFFISTDVKYNTNTELMSFSELNKVQNFQETSFNWKSFQTKKIPEMSGVEKEAVVAYLKKVYRGVSMKKLFRRCQLQLERCRKAEQETGSFARLFVTKNNVESTFSTKNVESIERIPPASKKKTFTKISEKKSCITTKGKKTVKEKDSPLLTAFRKQSQQNDNSCNEPKISNSKERKKKLPKNSSLRDYLILPAKVVDDSSRNSEQVLRKSSRTRRQHADEESDVCGRKSNTLHLRESINEDCKKRGRDCQASVENLDEIVVENVSPAKKKVKVDGRYSKRTKKGEKWKQDISKAEESAKDASLDTAKSPKISSDDDFVKTSKSDTRSTTRKAIATKRTIENGDGEAEQTGLRKSGRLQIKLATRDNKKESSKCENDKEIKSIDGETGSEIREINITSESAEKEVNVVAVVSETVDVLEKHPSSGTSCEPQYDVVVGQDLPVLWTECFKPAMSEEILGNNSAGSKLKKWLSEWKSLKEKKLNDMRRLLEKKNERLASRENGENVGNEWWYEDDEAADFDLSSGSDYSEDENILCNTMLLSGPTGCGKTSAVYACAEELGFKVIEVNSSSKRGGKYILSELQEATQSYHVAGKRNDAPNTLSSEGDISKTVAENGKKGRKNMKGKKKESAKQKLQKKSQMTAALPEGQMSLILLDEVDILFEEDKGFWVAVNSIRLNSKRPIVMTASDPCVNIDGRLEHILMKSPSVKLHAAHIQNVCLSKDAFVNPPEIQALAMLHHGDIRQSLLTLQFWVNSNAGECDPHGTSFKTEIYSSIIKNSGKQETSLGVANNVLNGNIASKKPFTIESEKPEDSMELSGTVESHGLEDTQMPIVKGQEVSPSRSTNICIHQLCLESLLGLRNVASSAEGALKVLSFPVEDDILCAKRSFGRKSLVASHCQALGFDIIRCNLESLSPCLFAWNSDDDDVSKSNLTQETNSCQDRSALKVEPSLPENENDALEERSEYLLENCRDMSIFDNEMGEGRQSNCELNEPKKEQSSAEAGKCLTVVDEVMESETQPKRYCIRKKLAAISLEAFTNFLEDMSFLDSELCCDIEADLRKRDGPFGNRHAHVIPGVEDNVDTKCTQFTYKSRTTLEEIRGVLEVASLEASHKHFHDSIAKADQKFEANSLDLISNVCDSKHRLCPAFEASSKRSRRAHGNMNEDLKDIPVLDSTLSSCSVGSSKLPLANSSLQLFTSSEILMSKTKQRRKQDLAAVLQNMPDANQLNRFSTPLDYLPALRNICRNEYHRRVLRIKRRFYHYLDVVGLNFPQSLIQLLSDDTFSNDRQDMK